MKARRPVDINLFKQAIETVEKNGPLKNRTALYNAVTSFYNTNTKESKITTSIVLLRINEWGLSVKTPKGERGDGLRLLRDIKTEPRIKEIDSDYVVNLKNIYPPKYHKKCERAENSRVAAIHLKCLDCCALQIREIAHCEMKECSLWLFRPYKAKDNGEIVELIDSEIEPTEIIN